MAPVHLMAQFCSKNHHKIVENLKIVQSQEIRNIHPTILVYLHNLVTLESQFCDVTVTIFSHFTIFCRFYHNFVILHIVQLCIVTKFNQQM